MKFSEDGERIVVRLSEQDGHRGTLRLPRKVQVLNMLEDVERETDSVDYTPFEILTLGPPCCCLAWCCCRHLTAGRCGACLRISKFY